MVSKQPTVIKIIKPTLVTQENDKNVWPNLQ